MEEYISRIMTAAEGRERLDSEIKQVLADKQILAMFLIHATEEFNGCDKETAMAAIDGEPEVGTVRVEPGMHKVRGEATESVINDEGKVFYDIRCHAVTPDDRRIKILINIEAQGNYYPGYPLESRGVFYCSRMISEQMDTEFEGDDYGKLKKVYSIWVCINSPSYAANSIVEYRLKPNILYGKFPAEKMKGYDLISLVMVHLGKEESANKLCGLLYTLLKSKEPLADRKRNLEENYNISMSRTFLKEVGKMCNYSEYVEERAAEKAREERDREMIGMKLLKGRSPEWIHEEDEYPMELILEVQKGLELQKQPVK